MNGPQHYAEAERILFLVESMNDVDGRNPWLTLNIAAAQAHATLALVAATAESGRTISPYRADEWAQATS